MGRTTGDITNNSWILSSTNALRVIDKFDLNALRCVDNWFFRTSSIPYSVRRTERSLCEAFVKRAETATSLCYCTNPRYICGCSKSHEKRNNPDLKPNLTKLFDKRRNFQQYKRNDYLMRPCRLPGLIFKLAKVSQSLPTETALYRRVVALN